MTTETRMEKRKLSPTMRMVLDFGPLLVFFAGYFVVRDLKLTLGGTEYSGFVLMTALFVPLLALTTFVAWRLTGRVSKMNIVTLVLVIVFGGLTIWFNDERFFKMKPTMIYALFAAILFVGLAQGKSYLSLVMDEVLPMDDRGWMILTRRLAIFFACLAVANEVIWRNFSTETWVSFKTFGLTVAVFGFFLTQGALFEKHAEKSEE